MENVYEKLLSVQMELKSPKNQYNKFGSYYYRNCEDILEAVKPLLCKNKMLLTVEDGVLQIGDRYYVKATATIFDCDSSCSVCATAYAREDESVKGMAAAQITGSTSSYARKYALNGLFAIDDSKDSDTEEAKNESNNRENNEIASENTQAVPEVSQERRALFDEMEAELLRTGYGTLSVMRTYKVDSLEHLSNLQLKDFLKKIKSVKDKEPA